MENFIKYNGLSKAEVLMVLYNASKPMGLGMFIATPNKMTLKQAEMLLKTDTYFDYIQGRVMKLDLSNDEGFDPWLYDRDNGSSAASRALDAYRKQKQLTAKNSAKTSNENLESTELKR